MEALARILNRRYCASQALGLPTKLNASKNLWPHRVCLDALRHVADGARSWPRERPGFFDVDERPADLSVKGDDLEPVNALIDLEIFRMPLEATVPHGDRSKGSQPPFDHVFMFKVLILRAMHSLSDKRCKYLIKDRLSFMRFLGLGSGRRGSRRQYDLDVSGGAEEGQRH